MSAMGIKRVNAKRVGKYLLAYTILFFAAFLLAYSPFLQEKRSFIWTVNDGRTQHYPTLVYAGRYLRQIMLQILKGDLSIPLFDLNLSMGGDIIGTLNYYGFGNPLYLLSAFVPTHYTEYLYDFLMVLRLYLAGLAFVALCVYHKKQYSHAIAGALVYVFCGYAMFSAVRHPYFIEPMIQLPLLLIGIDLVIQRKRPFVFILSVFYSALCGFYFLYMMTIMLGFYALIRFFDFYQENRAGNFFAMVRRIIGAYLMGIGLSAPIFFPAVIAFFTSGRAGQTDTGNLFFYGWSAYKYRLMRLIAPTGSWYELSLAAIVLPALIMLFLSKKRHRSLKLLLAVSVIFYVFPLGGYIMNGFGYSSPRWTFGFSLLLSYILVEMLPTLLEMDRKRQILCFAVFAAYGTVTFLSEKNRTVYYAVGTAMLATTLLVLYLFGEQDKDGKSGKRIGAAACVLLVVFNVGVNAIYLFARGYGNYINEFAVGGMETQWLETAIEREAEPYLKLHDGRFSGSRFTYNTGAVWHIPTDSGYWSMIGASVQEFWRKTEVRNMNTTNMFSGEDRRTGLGALLSVKYIIEKKNQAPHTPYGYSVLKETEEGNVIYKNEYALPWGYTYDSYMTVGEAEKLNGVALEDAMLGQIVVEDEIADIEKKEFNSNIVEIPYEITEEKECAWDGETLVVSKDGATMTLNVALPAGAEGYIRFQEFILDGSGQSEFWVPVTCANVTQSTKIVAANGYWGCKNYLINLGYSGEERTACTITFPKKGTYKLGGIQLFSLPMDKYPERIEALRTEPLENVSFGNNRITGMVDLSKNKILCMSIPYSKGWTAKVDGQKVEILQGNYAFMALPLTAGHHEIEFTYCTPGLKAGIAVSLVSVGIVIYLICQEKRKRRAS